MKHKQHHLFTTEDLMSLTGLPRCNFEYYRKVNVISPALERPLRYEHKSVIFGFMIKQLKSDRKSVV